MASKQETIDAAVDQFAGRLQAALEREMPGDAGWQIGVHPVVTDGAVITGWLAVIQNDAATPRIRRAVNLRVEDGAAHLRNPAPLAEALAYVPRRMLAAQETGR